MGLSSEAGCSLEFKGLGSVINSSNNRSKSTKLEEPCSFTNFNQEFNIGI